MFYQRNERLASTLAYFNKLHFLQSSLLVFFLQLTMFIIVNGDERYTSISEGRLIFGIFKPALSVLTLKNCHFASWIFSAKPQTLFWILHELQVDVQFVAHRISCVIARVF